MAGKGRIAQRTAKPRLPPRPQRLLLADNFGGELLAGDFSEESGATAPGGRRPNDAAGHDGARSLQHANLHRPAPLGSARPSAALIGPTERRRPFARLGWLSRVPFTLVPAPLAAPLPSARCLSGIKDFARTSGRAGMRPGEPMGGSAKGICAL